MVSTRRLAVHLNKGETKMWEMMSLSFKLSYLAAHSTVDAYLLEEDDALMELLRNDGSMEDCVEHINNNY